ncbi:MAG: PEP-CTERM sorting domain-containing protein [Pirellulales bacterium]
MRSRIILAVSVGFLLTNPMTATAQPLFFDDFNADSSADYSIVSTSDDVEINFAFDYSTLGIPKAPNTQDDSTLGLQMKANIDDPTGTGSDVREALTLHTNEQFSGSLLIKFDMWINANGPMPLGGRGSTEFVTVGVGGDGATVNDLGVTGVGGWTAVSGEGGASRGYRMYKNAGEQFPESGQFEAGVDPSANNASHEYYSQFGGVEVDFLPVQGGTDNQVGTTNPGVIGFGWHAVRLLVSANGGTEGTGPAVQWRIAGTEDENATEPAADLIIGTLDAGIGSAFGSEGSATIGYVDRFNSVSDNAMWSFGLADNLAVSSLTGDMDLDGDADFDDIATFVLGINTPDAYASDFGVPAWWAGDTDGDGDLDFDDIPGFVSILGGGNRVGVSAAVPEPSTLALFGLAVVSGLISWRRVRS